MEDFIKMGMEQKIEFVTSRYSVPGNLSKEEAFNRLLEKIDRTEKFSIQLRRNRQRIIHLSAAASIALLITVFIVIWDFSQIKIASGPVEQIQLSMPDGSLVSLNAVSTIMYSDKNFNKNRTLKLNGEAYFEVKEGSLFIVESKNGTVEVLGTSFNVHSRADYFKVSCSSGLVFVSTGARSDTISIGESVSWINGIYLRSIDTDIEQTLTWRAGEFYYKSTDLRFVLNEIERQFDVSIEASGIEDRLFTGSFYSGSLEEAIQIVCIPMGLEFEFIGKGKIRISP